MHDGQQLELIKHMLPDLITEKPKSLITCSFTSFIDGIWMNLPRSIWSNWSNYCESFMFHCHDSIQYHTRILYQNYELRSQIEEKTYDNKIKEAMGCRMLGLDILILFCRWLASHCQVEGVEQRGYFGKLSSIN